MGYASYRAAMQSDGVDEFKGRMRKAVTNYNRAREFYCRLDESSITARVFRCDAMVAYIGYWIASEIPEKKKLIDQCWGLTKDALKAFKEAGDAREHWRTFDHLSLSAAFGCYLEWDFQALEKIAKEAVELGEQTLSLYSTLGDPVELARTYAQTAGCLETFAFCFSDLDERERYLKKAAEYWSKANALSEEAAHIVLLDSLEGGFFFGLAPGTDKALSGFEKALAYGRKTKDKVALGWALDCLAFNNHWKALATEDPDEMVEVANKALRHADDAKRYYSAVNFVSPRGYIFWVHAPLPEYYWLLALYETDQSKRRDFLEKARDAAPDQLERAEASGYPEIVWLAHHALSKVLGGLAKIELNPENKKSLLEEGLRHRSESIKIHDQIEPFDYWNRGMMLNYLANIKQELSNLSKDTGISRSMLQEAVDDKENSLKLCIKELETFERAGSLLPFVSVGRWQYEYGDLLNRLYESTGKPEYLEKSIEVFKDAAESFQKPNLTSRMAECRWKAAQMYDALGEHLKASNSFSLASNNYNESAQKIPQLKGFYEDHALYMQAWAEIEKAKHSHLRQEYDLAEEHFEKAASLHKSSREWSYLASSYTSWAKVENAEELSRKEQSEDALRAFSDAARLFNEATQSLQAELSKINAGEEKQMVTNMLKANGLRHKYCIARIALEEAKILEKKGDHYLSSDKYLSAIETLEKITPMLESEQDRKEIRFITGISRAWQKMTQAEAEASPQLYSEASQLFEEVKEISPNEKARMLALGHSRFCRALEAGTTFADTRDLAMHAAAMQQLESAINYYMKADFKVASEYAKATRLLLDAYMFMDTASTETDPEKKAKLYIMTEKVLQNASNSYAKAENPAKCEEALKLLERVKEERELAVSLTEVLHAPIMSSTIAFPAPTPSFETAPGLEKFENAEIQASIIASQKELKIGDNLDLEIELVNAGKGPALLTKITEAIPNGFEIVEKPQMSAQEDGCLNMRGKRLDPLKTEGVRLILKPKIQGVFPLKPKVLYLDENGKHKTHEPEPVTITVKELGIRGWLKGER
jgi:tetratricopeptide (TPR) repeat protein